MATKSVILISLYYLDFPSGANRRFDQTVDFLSRQKDIRLTVIISKEVKGVTNCDKYDVISVDYSRKGRILSWLILEIILIRFRNHIIISDFWPCPVLCRLHWFKNHVLSLIHDARNVSTNRGDRESLSRRIIAKMCWNMAANIITVSNYSKVQIAKVVKRKPIHVLPNGFEPEFINYNGIRDIDILYVATFEERKNHQRLNVALQRLAYNYGPLKCVYLGRDNGLLKVINDDLVGKGLDVQVIEEVPNNELFRLYSSAKVLVNASMYEGFGMPLVEGAASGCQVVCSDIQVFREVTGDLAIYFDPFDPSSIERALTEAIANWTVDSSRVRKLTEFVGRAYTWESVNRGYLGLFETLEKQKG